MACLNVGCFHSGRQLLGLAEGVHRPAFLQRGLVYAFFCWGGLPASASQPWHASPAWPWRGGWASRPATSRAAGGGVAPCSPAGPRQVGKSCGNRGIAIRHVALDRPAAARRWLSLACTLRQRRNTRCTLGRTNSIGGSVDGSSSAHSASGRWLWAPRACSLPLPNSGLCSQKIGLVACSLSSPPFLSKRLRVSGGP